MHSPFHQSQWDMAETGCLCLLLPCSFGYVLPTFMPLFCQTLPSLKCCKGFNPCPSGLSASKGNIYQFLHSRGVPCSFFHNRLLFLSFCQYKSHCLFLVISLIHFRDQIGFFFFMPQIVNTTSFLLCSIKFLICFSLSSFVCFSLQEKLLFEPFSCQRDVAYIIVAPENDLVLNNVKLFFKEFSAVYEVCINFPCELVLYVLLPITSRLLCDLFFGNSPS